MCDDIPHQPVYYLSNDTCNWHYAIHCDYCASTIGSFAVWLPSERILFVAQLLTEDVTTQRLFLTRGTFKARVDFVYNHFVISNLISVLLLHMGGSIWRNA